MSISLIFLQSGFYNYLDKLHLSDSGDWNITTYISCSRETIQTDQVDLANKQMFIKCYMYTFRPLNGDSLIELSGEMVTAW